MPNGVGRPLKFKSPEALQELIDKYFNTCLSRRLLQAGGEVSEDSEKALDFTEDAYPTITGLCLSLDTTRDILIDYSERDAFTNTIKKAKARVEAFNEQRLFGNNVTGVIFNLKNNFGWKDKTEQDINAKVETKDGTALDAIRMAIEAKSIAD
jgi:hypothetical protein